MRQSQATEPGAELDVISGSLCRFCWLHSSETSVVETAGTVVVPSLGALRVGWLLVLPKRHIINLALLPSDEREEYAAVVDTYTQVLESRYGPVVQFEHGPRAAQRLSGCGIDHAHLHLVPMNVDLRAASIGIDEGMNDLHWSPANRPWDYGIDPDKDYLYVNDLSRQGWIAQQNTIPSQFYRRVIAKRMGLTDWDWKQAGSRDEYLRTLRDLAQIASR